MHFLTCYFLHSAFNKSGIKFGIIAVIIVALSPALHGSFYYISAASAVVPGMFFSALSVYFFTRYTESLNRMKKNAGQYFSGFWFFSLLSMGFGGQTAVFSVCLTVAIIILNAKKLPTFSAVCSFASPIVNFIILLIYNTFVTSAGVAAPQSAGIISSISESYTSGHTELFTRMIPRMLNYNGNTLSDVYFAVTFAVCGLFLFYRFLFFNKKDRKEENDETDGTMKEKLKSPLIKLSTAIILFAAPLLIGKNAGLPSVVGFALFIDAAVDFLVLVKFKITISKKTIYIYLSTVRIVVAAVLVLLFLVNAPIIFNGYKETHKNDQKAVNGFITAFLASDFDLKDIKRQNSRFIICLSENNNERKINSSIITESRLFINAVNSLSDYTFINVLIMDNVEFENVTRHENGLAFELEYINSEPRFIIVE